MLHICLYSFCQLVVLCVFTQCGSLPGTRCVPLLGSVNRMHLNAEVIRGRLWFSYLWKLKVMSPISTTRSSDTSHHVAYGVGVSISGTVFIRNFVNICVVVQKLKWGHSIKLRTTKTVDYM
jgi:hypothetical protein